MLNYKTTRCYDFSKHNLHKYDILYHWFFGDFNFDISILLLDNNLVSKHLTKVFKQKKNFASSQLSQLSEPGVSLVCGRGTLSWMDWAPAGSGDLMDLWGNHCHHYWPQLTVHTVHLYTALYTVFTPIGAGVTEDTLLTLWISNLWLRCK